MSFNEGRNIMMKETEIRLDWNAALYEMEDKETLYSYEIGWGFSTQDLLILCCLHEAGKHRDYIEYLLEDCNFHHECGLLHEHKYDECRKLVFEEWPHLFSEFFGKK